MAKLFQFSLMTGLQHRHSCAALSTQGALSGRFHFFQNLISSLSQEHTYQSLSSAFWTTVTHVSCFCLALCIFLPLSVTVQVLLFTNMQTHRSVTPLSAPLQTNPAYFPWHISVPVFPSTSESRLCYFTIFKQRYFN